MWDRLTLTSAPAAEPITASEFKTHERISHTSEDTKIEAFITAARNMIDGRNGIGIAMVTQTWRLTLDCFPSHCIRLPINPVQSISSITYVDADGVTQTMDSDDYTLLTDATPAILSPAYGLSWPSHRPVPGAVKITFVAGYGNAASVPADLKQAVHMMVAHWYADREGTAAEAPAVCAILDRYRASWVQA